MIKKMFAHRAEVDTYLQQQKVRMESKCLTRSEREELKQYLEKPELLIAKGEDSSNPKNIITNINILRKSCIEVSKGDDYKQIMQDLKDTLNAHPEGWGMSANQIGYDKKISFIKIPTKINQQTKQIEYTELILINAKIIEKIGKPSLTIGEGCLSFPGVKVNTDRYLYVAVEYLDEKLDKKAGMFQGTEALAVQHEIDHQSGITIFDRKHKRS